MAKKNQPADLGSLKREELYQLAQQYDVKGRSKLNKEELIAALSVLVNQPDNEKSSAENEKKSQKAQVAKKSGKAQPLTEDAPAKNRTTRASKKTAVETTIKPAPEAPTQKTSTSEKPVAPKDQKKKVLAETEAKTRKTSSQKKADNIKPAETKRAGSRKTANQDDSASTPVKKAGVRKGRKAADVEPSASLFDINEKTPITAPEKKESPAEKEAADRAKESILSRSFARQKNDGDARKKTGAIVQSVAIPVEIPTTLKPEEPSPKAKQIEEERSRRHASLKTTMEIPVFSTPASEMVLPVAEEDLTGDLPADYGETRIVVQVRDPHWAHAYWQIPRAELKRLEMSVGIFEFAHSHFVLRVHNVTDGFTQDFSL
ncbi:MAG: DUF4912 domain-containing protein, partial [Candidatus Rifleibacteriota bacterium]